CLQYNSDCRTF
nr:immunoglobulin light chain junction region [Macaca mulatta]MPN84878.1 immunoglobulin light chain junction region [Macaca mulatta]MPN84888.1 immunoglobulin light chain junction region [Macaca mulatta]MPN84901.1 immunoglobulin light chain junction region [Macaca mulatta]MPN84905.1 immunoglobulin light chain junction region [Macaca mulatta]